jgi:hypothetical protein
MNTQKRSLMSSNYSNVQQHQTDGVVDMELDCIICRSRLYVPDASIDSVLASLNRTGAAVLICPAGHAQLVRWKRVQGRSRHD